MGDNEEIGDCGLLIGDMGEEFPRDAERDPLEAGAPRKTDTDFLRLEGV